MLNMNTILVLCLSFGWSGCGKAGTLEGLIPGHGKSNPQQTSVTPGDTGAATTPTPTPPPAPQVVATSPGEVDYNSIATSEGKSLAYSGDLSFKLNVDLASDDSGNCAYSADKNTTMLKITAGMVTTDIPWNVVGYSSNGPTDQPQLYAPGNLCEVAFPYNYNEAPIYLTMADGSSLQIGQFRPLVGTDATSSVLPLFCEQQFSSVCSVSLKATISSTDLTARIVHHRMPNNYLATVLLTITSSNKSFVAYNRQ